MQTKIIINLVDGKKTENGYEFSDYSEPRKPDMGSTANYMASIYTGEYVTWDESKTAIDTALEYLNKEVHFKSNENTDVMDFMLQTKNVRWEYNSESKVFYSMWVENGEATGDAFRIASIKKVREGQTYREGEPVEF